MDARADAVKTVVLATPAYDADDPVWGFVAKHVDALAGSVERVVVITTGPSIGVDGEPAEIVTVDGSTGGARSALADVLLDSADDPVVVVLDDLALLAQARSAAGARARILWWTPQVPSERAVTIASRFADGLVAMALPGGDTAGLPIWVVGAGVDLESASPLPPQRPLQLLALGRTAPRKNLDVAIRAVAVARSNGIDTRLTIAGPSTNAVEVHHRFELEELVKNVALTSVVRVESAIEPGAVLRTIADAHVLIDASTGDDLPLASLEAMASARPVLTSNPRLARMLPDQQVLTFEPGNAADLARRISLLSEMWPASLATTGATARESVRVAHAGPLLLSQWNEAIEGVQAQPVRAETGSWTPPSSVPAANGRSGADAATAALFPEPDSVVPDPVPPDPAAPVRRFLGAWATLDRERALACFEQGALRFDAASGAGGTPVADHLAWAAQTAESFEFAVDELDVVGDSVVAVRRERWMIGSDELTVVARSLFEVAGDRIASWNETEVVSSVELVDAPASAERAEIEVSTPAPAEMDQSSPPATAVPDEGAAPAHQVAELEPERAAGDAIERAPLLGDAPDRIAEYEEQVHRWRREAMIWRDRAIAGKALAEAYRANVEDLRALVDVLKAQLGEHPTQPQPAPSDDVDTGPEDDDGDNLADRPVVWTNPHVAAEPANGASGVREVERSGEPRRRATLGHAFLTRSTRFAQLLSRHLGKL